MSLTAERLRELLHYDPETGVFTYRAKRGKQRVGSIAGTIRQRDGYRTIFIDYQGHAASRLAVLYMTGRWPAQLVDHRNHDTGDDRWCNLREATQSQNLTNKRHRRDGRDLPRGVFVLPNGSYQASVGRNGYLGVFRTVEAAAAVARSAYIQRGVVEFVP